MSCCKDYQKSKVYCWERLHMREGQWLEFAEIEPYVHAVWKALGLKYPPLVENFHAIYIYLVLVYRLTSALPATGASHATILHELAHALTCTVAGSTDKHGPEFVGIYMKLAAQHLGESLFKLWYTAEASGVAFNPAATPSINDVQ